MTAPYGTAPSGDSPYGGPPAASVVPPPQTVRARVALILAAVAVLLTVVDSVIGIVAPVVLLHLDLPLSTLGFLYGPVALVQVILSITALILAIGPLRGPGPRGIAGAAAGISVAYLITVVTSYALNAIAGLFF